MAWTPEGQPQYAGQLELNPFPYAGLTLGVGVDDIASIEGTLGGRAEMLLEYPREDPLREARIVLTGELAIEIWFFGFHRFAWPFLEYTWPRSEGRCAPFEPGQPEMFMLPRDYLYRDGGYAVFRANEKPARSARGIITTETRVLENAFGRSTPDLAASGDDLIVAWSHDDPARSAVNRTAIWFVRYDAATELWSDPAPVTDGPPGAEGTADFNPSIGHLPNNDVLLAWENVSEVLIDPGEPGDPCIAPCETECIGDPDPELCEWQCQLDCKLEEMKSKMEIAVSRYDAVTGQWSVPENLTSNDRLDRSPLLVTANDGTAMLTWISNDQGSLIGTTEAPNDVHFATYNGVTWSSPADVALGVPSMLKTAMAYNGTEAVIVYSADTSGDTATPEDREIFAIVYDGGAWDAPVRVTDDAIPDDNPQVAYDVDGDLLLLWYHGGDIRMKTNPSLTGVITDAVTVVDLPTSASMGAADFQLATGPTGEISLIWQDPSRDLVDMWSAAYDPALDVWAPRRRLTIDDSMEYGMAPTYDASGDLLVSYDKAAIEYETRTIEAYGEQIQVDGIPYVDRRDFYVLRHRVGGDLAIFDSDVSVSPANPSPGDVATIGALVYNLGTVAATDIAVAFYDGDPAAGGLLIDTVVCEGTLLGGEYASVSAQWVVPTSTVPHALYAVADPDHEQEDGFLANNAGHISGVMKPDLTVTSIVVQETGAETRRFLVRVKNTSGLGATGVSCDLRRDAADGELLTSLSVPGTLMPGAYHDLSWIWDVPSVCEATFNIFAVADYNNTIDEYREDNNTRSTVVPLVGNYEPFDLNYDGDVNIIGDVTPFVDCLYRDDCHCPDPGCLCPGDCNGDGDFNIIGDVPCFVDCLYRDDCQWQDGGRAMPMSTDGLSVGGAIFTDLDQPLLTGLSGVEIAVTAVGQPIAEQYLAYTDDLGIWRIDGLSPGAYEVHVEAPGYRVRQIYAGLPVARDTITVEVNEAARSSNGSIKFLAAPSGRGAESR